jgi:hypothetical protein
MNVGYPEISKKFVFREISMNDPEREEYAQKENDYILSLLRTDQPNSGEDPLELALRNCSATTRCFGETDPLHAMALNTLAFMRIYMEKDVDQACAAAIEAADILKDLKNHEQMLLESRLLTVQAKILMGSTTWSAIENVFEFSSTETDQTARIEEVCKFLSSILKASVFKEQLDRPLLIITLEITGEQLVNETESTTKSEGSEMLKLNLQDFLQMYGED